MGAQNRRRKANKHASVKNVDAAAELAVAKPIASPVRSRRYVTLSALALAALAALVIVGVLSWRSPKAPTPQAPTRVSIESERMITESEPNDQPTTAQDVGALPVSIAGVFEGDPDLFRFRVEGSGGWLFFAYVEGLDGLHLRLVREGDGGGERAAVVAPGQLGAIGTAGGSYVLFVDGDTQIPHGPYRLHARLQQSSRAMEWEPNDRGSKPNEPSERPVTAGDGDIAHHVVSGWLSRPEDVDCFRVPLKVPPAGAVLRFELEPPHDVTVQLDVFDSDVGHPAPLVLTTGQTGKRVIIPNLGGRSWEHFYVACVRVIAGFAPAATYRLDVRTYTPSGPFEFEPNDSAATASALPRGTGVDGYLAPGDVDWYRVSYGSEPVVHVAVMPPDDVRAVVVLHSESAGELARREAKRPGERVEVDATGVDLVEVRALEGTNIDKTYRIDAR